MNVYFYYTLILNGCKKIGRSVQKNTIVWAFKLKLLICNKTRTFNYFLYSYFLKYETH